MIKTIGICLSFLLLATLALGQTPITPPAPNNNIFEGGNRAGWYHSGLMNLHTTNAIYNGGINDGWGTGLHTNFGQRNPIFEGGIGAGWYQSDWASLHTANNIYNGGSGDGWSEARRENGPLPVNLISFSATLKDQDVLLNWTTITEQGTDYFEIERSNGTQGFSKIGKVTAKEPNEVKQNYSFTDRNPIKGDNLYRLKIMDRDGSATYSQVILVQIIGSEKQVVVYPNPVKDWVQIKLPKAYDQVVSGRILSSNGQIVLSFSIPARMIKSALNLKKYPSGTYLIQLNLPEGQSVLKIIK